jgi:16S rRNA (guanine1207-N2)-methyltransferase
MSHYFHNDSSLDHKVKGIDLFIRDMSFQFQTDLGVFSKDSIDFGTRTLIEHIEIPSSATTVIDMGCGYGPIGIVVAKLYTFTKVYLYDVNERAVDLARKNAILNKVDNVIVATSFLFEHVTIQADVIITNPPIRAGKLTIFRLYEDAFQTLNPGGLFYAVIQKKQGAPSTVVKLKELFGNCEIVDRSKGYWVLLARKS